MTERKPPGMSFESWIDAQVARAVARGDFADLPGAGRPLPRRDRAETSYDWVVSWARRENVDVAGMLPPALALRREREQLPGLLARQVSESAVRRVVEDFNDRVREAWRRPQEGPSVVVGLVDADEAVARWRQERPEPDGAAAEPGQPRDPQQPRRRRRWLHRREG